MFFVLKSCTIKEWTFRCHFYYDNIRTWIYNGKLHVVVIDAHQYTQEALIQIAGRVGRKLECPTGKVLFFHEGVSMNMIQAKKRFKG
ncbi:hypothetical protein ACVQ90_15295 [Staphylococcus aureus]